MATAGSNQNLSSATTANRTQHRSLFERILRIRPGEGYHVSVLFLQLFAIAGIFVLGRTVRDTLFLSRYAIAALPWMFVLYGVVSAAIVALYGRFADRIPRSTLLYGTSAVGIASYLAVWLCVRAQLAWIYPFFYIWAEVVANLFVVQFWTVAAEFDYAREARRLNATIGSARPLGAIFFGFSTGTVVSWIGTEQLMAVLVALMVVVAACMYALRRQPSIYPARPDGGRIHQWEEERLAHAQGYFRTLSLLILVMFVTLTVGDYQFKIIAGSAYQEDALAQFFSLFYGVVGTLSMAFQLLVTPRLLAKMGVGSALTVMPGVFGISSLALLAWPGLAAASAMKFADNGLQFTLHETTMQSLYAPFHPARRARTRAFLEGAVKPLSYGAGGLLVVLLLHSQLDVRRISFITVGLVIIWHLLVPLVRRGYLRSLEMALAGPAAAQLFDEPFVLGSAERRLLIQALRLPDASLAMLAMEQLRNERSAEFRAALATVMRRREPALRARAIRLLESMGDSAHVPDFRLAAQDPDPTVRAAAASALVRFVGNERPDELFPFMDDQSAEVRTAVLAGLIRDGGLEGATRAGTHLLRLQESAAVDDRREACAVLTYLGRTAYLSLGRLLRDPSARVRRAALRAAAGTADARLVPLMVDLLHDPACRAAAVTALGTVGAHAVQSISRALRDRSLPRAVRLELPRILSRIGSQESFDVLWELKEDPDSHIRLRVYAALGRLRKQLGMPPIPPDRLEPHVKREVFEACGNLLDWNAARERFETELLAEEMSFRMRRAERRIMRLLELTYDLREVSVILAALEVPKRRTDALDALETLLDPALRRLIIPLLERPSTPEALEMFSELSLCTFPPVEFMLLQAHHPNPYVSLVALDAMARAGERAAIPAAKRALEHPEPLVREAGLRALAKLDPENVRSCALPLREDADPAIARLAKQLSDGRSPGQTPPEDIMYGTVERILLLKEAPLFSRLSGEDLAPLARLAEVVTCARGEVIYQRGDPSDHFYVVVRGMVALESMGKELRRVGPSQTLGELAVLDRGPQSTSARALENTELLRIGAEEFFEVLREQPEIAESLIRILAGQIRDAHQRLAEQLSMPG